MIFTLRKNSFHYSISKECGEKYRTFKYLLLCIFCTFYVNKKDTTKKFLLCLTTDFTQVRTERKTIYIQVRSGLCSKEPS